MKIKKQELIQKFLKAINTFDETDKKLIRLEIFAALKPQIFLDNREIIKRGESPPEFNSNEFIEDLIQRTIQTGISQKFLFQSLSISIIGTFFEYATFYEERMANKKEEQVNLGYAKKTAESAKEIFSSFISDDYLSFLLETK